MKLFSDLKYDKEEMQDDAVEFFKTQLYLPSYMENVKAFLADDLADFKLYYDDAQYVFQHIYYDEYVVGYDEVGDRVIPKVDYRRLSHDLENSFSSLQLTDDEIDRYMMNLESEFRKNSFLSHMEPYYIGYDAVAATVVAGYSQDPIYSIYSIIRECAMALHLKKLQPELMRRFGYRYQYINENYTGEERLHNLMKYRERYRLTFKNTGAFRVVHSSVFAYVYLYLRSYLTGETEAMEDFILDTSSSQIFLLLQGETLQTIDFPIVKYALRKLKTDGCKYLLHPDASIDWDALFDFAMDVIIATGGMGNLRALGVDGISAKTIQSFWNKSANMQQMLKILRRLVMNNSDPIFQRLIEMCEYRLGRPGNAQKKMERFIEMTRRIMERERAYELTRPRTMAQELLAAFPSVFLVYFQWHHNFRNIYPKVSPKDAYNEQKIQENRQAQDKLSVRIYSNANERREKERLYDEQQKKRSQNSQDKLSFSVGQAKEKAQEKAQAQQTAEKVNWQPITSTERKENTASTENLLREKKQQQNSI
ncbi:MAG: hypothetical protein J6Y91_00715 [Alphaproteobacteria bacterium]|nr:hypothetical protein [Alphaproteobacteria bacterium]